jgi:hypothetical protein
MVLFTASVTTIINGKVEKQVLKEPMMRFRQKIDELK